MDLWSWIWWFIWMFAWVAYFTVLVYIVIDLFRDHQLNGWAKALWLIFLLIVPFIAGLVYLIARGQGMSERNQPRQVEYTEDDFDRIRAQSFANPADEIAKAKALRDQGAISDGEFEAIKAKALGSKF
ncbi:SHOCT domain-containing protein [Agromyces sp. MMS24-K17]|uniref:SHOCT domain-containing protein n=1 Tax=Agromyces sp. MMS24-K17 TaxID=3372850 RepID=UPI0037546B69